MLQGVVKIFHDPKHTVTASLRESCKILTKGYCKEFLSGCLTEHPVHDPVYFNSVLNLCEIILAEVSLGPSELLLRGERQGIYIYIF